jgi:sec-independent protein translocase protein TatC
MTFIDHLEALRWHIMRMAIAIVVFAFLIFIYRDWIFDNVIQAPARANFFSYHFLCSLSHTLHIGQALCMQPIDIKFQYTTVGGPFNTALNMAMIGGIVAAFPYLMWELWSFIKPALSSKEIKYARGSIFWVSLCFFTGVAFGYYLLAPFTFNFLANFTLGTAGINDYKPTIEDFSDTLTNLLLLCGVAFELPVILFVLAKIGIVSASFLKKNFKYAVVIILVVAGIITPSPDWISQLIVALPIFILYGISIFVVSRVDNEKKKEEAEWS